MASVKNVRFHNRFGGGGPARSNEVCKFYKRGTCNKNPCAYLHVDSPPTDARLGVLKQFHPYSKGKLRNGAYPAVKSSLVWTSQVGGPEAQNPKKGSDFGSKCIRRNYIFERSLAVATGDCGSGRRSDPPKKLPNLPFEKAAAGDSAPKEESAQGRLNRSTEAQSVKLPVPSPKKAVVSAAGDSAPEVGSAEKNLIHVTANQLRKLPVSNPKSFPVSAPVNGESGVENTQESAIASTEEVRLKKIRELQQCHLNSSVLPDERIVYEDKTEQKTAERPCERWMSGNCEKGDHCQFLHSWFRGYGFSMLAKLSGHSQALSGIALPSDSDKLLSGSSDGTVRVWDCLTGLPTQIINLGEKVGSLISEGAWVFVGMPNVVKAWNIKSGAECVLDGPVGQVQAMAVGLDMLFAGAQSGIISVWKGSTGNPNPFQLAASLKGHLSSVICLAVRANRLYSGSTDRTIRVWCLDSLECIHILNGHTDAVMSLIWSNQYLLSCSLDRTIKVWSSTEGDKLEVTYTHSEEDGAIALCGVTDGEHNPILLCSSMDDSVRLYELPSFAERGRIFSEKEVRIVQAGPSGLFFTGDGSGMLTVWKLAEARPLAS
ncbi:hypothetical protein Tsubulata_032621 [Turnera subulata]|uniref:C3H1-type domain-containing protein n=1 Tax=Turnera subulata TaxID=218843 RepID=A0A9Q0G4J7_9ROSI|nr:hypothetical protein Tsubulata_032621 [Turnera subulata]